MSTIPTLRQLQERFDRLRLDLDSAQSQLGTALLNGNEDAAGVVRAEIAQLESQARDVTAMLKVRPSMDDANVTVDSLRREHQLADARNAARAVMKDGFARYRADFSKLKRPEKRSRAAELRAIASKAGRVPEFKEFMADLAAQYQDDELSKY